MFSKDLTVKNKNTARQERKEEGWDEDQKNIHLRFQHKKTWN